MKQHIHIILLFFTLSTPYTTTMDDEDSLQQLQQEQTTPPNRCYECSAGCAQCACNTNKACCYCIPTFALAAACISCGPTTLCMSCIRICHHKPTISCGIMTAIASCMTAGLEKSRQTIPLIWENLTRMKNACCMPSPTAENVMYHPIKQYRPITPQGDL